MDGATRFDGGSELSMMDPRVLDPQQELVARADMAAQDIDQVVRLMDALRRWREAEHNASEASRRYMNLGDTDMRAIRFVMAAQRNGISVTPGALSEHLGISTASTTKLLDRLTAGGHLRRLPHPSDRRSLVIEVTEETARAARETVGRMHARRFQVAAQLDADERETVTRFLHRLAESTEPAEGRDGADDERSDGDAGAAGPHA